MPLEWVSPYLVAGTALIFIMGNLADAKIKKVRNRNFNTDEDTMNYLTSYRNKLSYSKHTKNIINLITTEKNGFPDTIVGSGKYRIQSYPGDVDLMETIEMCCSKDDIARYVTEQLQDIAKRMKGSKNVYLGDFKAGLDHRYKLNYGFINIKNKLVGYNRRKVIDELNRLHSEKLLTKKDLERLKGLLPPNSRDRHIHQWDEFRDAYRKFYVVRWSIDAVIRGYKNIGPVNNKVKLLLRDAVKHRTVVKLDAWAEVDENFFTEVTNVLLLLWNERKRGKRIYLNLPLGDYPHKILYEIKHYGKGPNPNYMKTLKRMWTLANHMNTVKPKSENKLISKLRKLFSNDLSILYQLYSETEVIMDMVNKLRNPPYKKLIAQLNRFKSRFNVVWDGLPQPEYINIEVESYKRIDKVAAEMKKPMNKINRRFITKHLKFIKDGLFYLWNGKPDAKYLKNIVKFKHHLNPKHVGELWDLKEWNERRWNQDIKEKLSMRDVLKDTNVLEKMGFERGISSEISKAEEEAWGVRRYILETRIDINHFDYILEDKYILKKPVPAETVDSEKYAEKYMLNPDLTYS